jgi:hypothetical protein
MFLGHFGLALAAKRVIPGASLGTTVMAAQWADGVWPLFVLLGSSMRKSGPASPW